MSKKSKKSKPEKPKPETTATALATALEVAGVYAADLPSAAPDNPNNPPCTVQPDETEKAAATAALETTEAETLTDLKPPKASEILARIAAESAALIAPPPPATETASAPAPTAEQAAAIAEAEKAVETAKAALATARANLAKLKKGPTAPDVDATGKPLTAGHKAWQTRVARGTVPAAKPKAPKAPIDPNAPNLTAGQKAWLTRQARLADPNYQPPTKAAPKAKAAERMSTAIAAAFPTGEQFGNGTRVCMSA